jgi:hypothetical protein
MKYLNGRICGCFPAIQFSGDLPIGLDINLIPYGTTVPLNSKIDLFVYKLWFETQILKHAYTSENI